MPKGHHGFFVLSAISKVIAGFLFEINGYLPFICSLLVTIFVSILSMCYIEPVKKQTKNNITNVKKQIKEIQQGFQYVLKAERVKALVLAASLIASLLSILVSYRTSLLQDVKMPVAFMGIISAALSIASAYGSKKQNEFHNQFGNKSIIVMAFIISISTLLAGIVGLKAEGSAILIMIIVILYLVTKFAHGIFYTMIDRYLRNFTNKNIDTKVFATKNVFVNVISAILGILASFLLDKMTTAYCMITVGIAFTILYLLMGMYMKTRVGLKPEEYSKEERKYDELLENRE